MKSLFFLYLTIYSVSLFCQNTLVERYNIFLTRVGLNQYLEATAFETVIQEGNYYGKLTLTAQYPIDIFAGYYDSLDILIQNKTSYYNTSLHTLIGVKLHEYLFGNLLAIIRSNRPDTLLIFIESNNQVYYKIYFDSTENKIKLYKDRALGVVRTLPLNFLPFQTTINGNYENNDLLESIWDFNQNYFIDGRQENENPRLEILQSNDTLLKFVVTGLRQRIFRNRNDDWTCWIARFFYDIEDCSPWEYFIFAFRYNNNQLTIDLNVKFSNGTRKQIYWRNAYPASPYYDTYINGYLDNYIQSLRNYLQKNNK